MRRESGSKTTWILAPAVPPIHCLVLWGKYSPFSVPQVLLWTDEPILKKAEKLNDCNAQSDLRMKIVINVQTIITGFVCATDVLVAG